MDIKNNENMFDDKEIEEKSLYHYNKQLAEQNDYQNSVTEYTNRKYEYSIKKQYNPKIVELYHNGLLVIDNIEYKLKDFFIIFDDNLNNFHLKCINPKFKTEEISYNKAVRFIDTTAFIELVNNSNIIENRIIINNINLLNDIVSKWNGYLHSETIETDAVINKRLIK